MKSFPGGSAVKNTLSNAGDAGSIPGSGRSLEKEMATRSSILALRNSMDRGAWWATSMGCQRTGHDLVTKKQQQQ